MDVSSLKSLCQVEILSMTLHPKKPRDLVVVQVGPVGHGSADAFNFRLRVQLAFFDGQESALPYQMDSNRANSFFLECILQSCQLGKPNSTSMLCGAVLCQCWMKPKNKSLLILTLLMKMCLRPFSFVGDGPRLPRGAATAYCHWAALVYWRQSHTAPGTDPPDETNMTIRKGVKILDCIPCSRFIGSRVSCDYERVLKIHIHKFIHIHTCGGHSSAIVARWAAGCRRPWRASVACSAAWRGACLGPVEFRPLLQMLSEFQWRLWIEFRVVSLSSEVLEALAKSEGAMEGPLIVAGVESMGLRS